RVPLSANPVPFSVGAFGIFGPGFKAFSPLSRFASRLGLALSHSGAARKLTLFPLPNAGQIVGGISRVVSGDVSCWSRAPRLGRGRRTSRNQGSLRGHTGSAGVSKFNQKIREATFSNPKP